MGAENTGRLQRHYSIEPDVFHYDSVHTCEFALCTIERLPTGSGAEPTNSRLARCSITGPARLNGCLADNLGNLLEFSPKVAQLTEDKQELLGHRAHIDTIMLMT